MQHSKTKTHGQTGTETDTQTGRDRQTHRQTEKAGRHAGIAGMEMESTRWPVEAAVRNRALNRTALVNMNGEQLKTAMCGFWERTRGARLWQFTKTGDPKINHPLFRRGMPEAR